MPAKKSSASSKPAKRPAKKAVKKSAPKSRGVTNGKKTREVPTDASTRATSATPGRVMTRREGAERKVIGVVSTITTEDIALRAYYISERRRNLGLPGDPQSDWLEAEKQLRC
jgi:hypothetical protein